ncbi:hypothetical protein DMUE_2242 [Dictyocoela muelleri]|nr:hypothetical protein DMUE_2242 [Dictyocoela muelleri]
MKVDKFKVHTSDIKDILCNEKEIITCSRDGTINILDHELTIKKKLNPLTGFINSVEKYDNHLFSGLQSGLILHYTFKDQNYDKDVSHGIHEKYNKFNSNDKINKDKINNDKINNDKINKDEINKGEINKDKINKYEINKGEINKGEINKDEINNDKINNDEINKDELNKDKINNDKINNDKINKGEIINNAENKRKPHNEPEDRDKNDNTEIYDLNYISIHTQNVTSLKITKNNIFGNFNEEISVPKNNFYLVSSSWDAKVCIIDFYNSKIKTFLFNNGIWDIQIHDDKLYICGIDKLISIYQEGIIKTTLNLHTSCVRSIGVINNNLYSLSNDGKIFNWRDKELENSRDLQNISYKLKIIPNSEDYKEKKLILNEKLKSSEKLKFDEKLKSSEKLKFDEKLKSDQIFFKNDEQPLEHLVVISGEKFVTIFDKNLKFLKKLILDVECWSINNVGKKLLIGGGDGNLYVVDLNEFLNNNENVVSIDVDFNENDDDRKVKIVNGMVYKKNDDKWELIGSVVDNSHTFEVEVDGQLLKLTFTDDENTYTIADRFLREHKLNDGYREEIVNFIRNNFRKKERFFIYDSININGIRKVLGPEYDEITNYLENLAVCDKNYYSGDISDFEESLKKLIIKNKFVALDIYRYLITKELINMNCNLDLAFLFKIQIENKKEAIAFTRLITNLYTNSPFNLDIFRDKIRGFYDYGWISQNDIDNYERNRIISMNSIK